MAQPLRPEGQPIDADILKTHLPERAKLWRGSFLNMDSFSRAAAREAFGLNALPLDGPRGDTRVVRLTLPDSPDRVYRVESFTTVGNNLGIERYDSLTFNLAAKVKFYLPDGQMMRGKRIHIGTWTPDDGDQYDTDLALKTEDVELTRLNHGHIAAERHLQELIGKL